MRQTDPDPRACRALRALALLSALSASSALSLAAQVRPYPLVLGLPATARYAGLANAGVAVHGDAGAVFINPAGIATIRHGGVEATYHYSHEQPVEGAAAAAFRVKQFTFGGGVHYLRLDPSSPNADNVLSVGTAVYRYGIIATGVSAKYISVEDTLGHVSRSAAGDVGILIALFDLVAVAASFQNVAHDDLSGGGVSTPHSSHLGLVFNFTDPQLTWVARVVWERVWPEDADARNKVAAEVGVQLGGAFLTLRGGTGLRTPETEQSESAVGASVGFKKFSVDYAYQAKTALGADVQRLGVRLTL
jgi:hypothetical protein